ncbi:MAG: cytochrome b/b6 domain-containing protein [Thermodesulfobacteriota bacterium]
MNSTDSKQEEFVLYEVWDSLTRLLHWLNAFCVLFLSILGGILYFRAGLKLSNPTIDTFVTIHVYVGYILAAGIILRWIWLFMGPPLSTLKDIIPATKEQMKTAKQTLLFYLRGFRGEPPFYVGHNPLAGFAYMTFFVVSALQIIIGLMLNQVPPLPSGVREPPYILIMGHDIGFYVILVYILMHLSALIIHELVESRSIISSMIHGKKVFKKEEMGMVEDYVNSLREE